MAELARAVATLRIFGDALDPAEVTRVLGVEPSTAERKGEAIAGRSGHVRVAKTGRWDLRLDECVPGDPDAQVQGLLARIRADIVVWRALASRFDIDLFCGWFMAGGNEGVELSPATLLALGERGIRLGIDLYAPDDD